MIGVGKGDALACGALHQGHARAKALELLSRRPGVNISFAVSLVADTAGRESTE